MEHQPDTVLIHSYFSSDDSEDTERIQTSSTRTSAPVNIPAPQISNPPRLRNNSPVDSTDKDIHHTPSPCSTSPLLTGYATKPPFDVSDFECSLCFRLFCKPITTPCGHTYCKNCLLSSLKYSPLCPLCRHKLEHSNKYKYTINIVLLNVLEKYFKDEYQNREKEEEEEEQSEEQLEKEKEAESTIGGGFFITVPTQVLSMYLSSVGCF
mmetsp:Transcript_6173/g.8613  ORF Transcript_6173/g.8613 Transcript_6173/m.8613 type:complete len:209 (+) Transcript_6173:188-814(+)